MMAVSLSVVRDPGVIEHSQPQPFLLVSARSCVWQVSSGEQAARGSSRRL